MRLFVFPCLICGLALFLLPKLLRHTLNTNGPPRPTRAARPGRTRPR